MRMILIPIQFSDNELGLIGLEWKDINTAGQTITISPSLSRSGKGSKQMRGKRKNKEVTVIDLSEHIHTMLEGRFTAKTKSENLIFIALKGKAIDDGYFSQEIWKKVLAQARVTRRPPYNYSNSGISRY